MNSWILPTLSAMVMWGLWGFIPKLTTRYLSPQSAIVYEGVGGLIVVMVMLISLNFQVETHPKGIALAISTGILGFLGALSFLFAVTKGPVTLVATLSALYPLVSILLAIAVLNESLSLRQWVGVMLGLVAMILVAA